MKNGLIAVLALMLASACSKDKDTPENPPNPNEEELVTTAVLVFTDATDSALSSTFVFRDIDGPGGNAPEQFDTIQLQGNHTYFLQLYLLDETQTPAADISQEVLEEGDEHQFFFAAEGGIQMNTTYLDQDVDGNPIGLLSQVETGTPGQGAFRVVLKHQPGVKAPAPGNAALGDTDLELLFQVGLY